MSNVEKIKRRISENPEEARLHFKLARAYIKLDDLGEAIEALQNAIDLEPLDVHYHLTLAKAFAKHSEYAKAEEQYKRILSLDPSNIKTHKNLGLIFDFYLQDPQFALTHYQRYSELGGDESRILKRLKLLRKRTQPRKTDERPVAEIADYATIQEADDNIFHLVGTRLGNFEIESLIGRGGMGVVYKARQASLNRTVAVKILLPSFGLNPLPAERFQREARAVAKLNHPNIIKVYDIGEDKELKFFSMEYVEGQNLEDVLREKGPMDPDEAIGITFQAGLALEHAHKNNIIHRDIKPANILLNNKGIVKVMDFGLAKIVDEESELTQRGVLLGTPDYMSPEQCWGEELDHRTDIYSLGVVLYEMLAGGSPFQAENTSEIIYRIAHENPRDVTNLNPNLPSGLGNVVGKAMAKEKKKRYPTIAKFLKDLSKC
jgi:tetratricopeptide (TPR) repeat protein